MQYNILSKPSLAHEQVFDGTFFTSPVRRLEKASNYTMKSILTSEQ